MQGLTPEALWHQCFIVTVYYTASTAPPLPIENGGPREQPVCLTNAFTPLASSLLYGVWNPGEAPEAVQMLPAALTCRRSSQSSSASFLWGLNQR